MDLVESSLALLEQLPPGWPGLALVSLLGLGAGALVATLLTSLLHARMNGHLRDRFQTLSAEALDRSNERFLALAGERLGALEQASRAELAKREAAVDALVRPLRDSLSRVDEKLQRVETERRGQHESLTKHLELLAGAHRELERQTQQLKHALKTPNVRGRWGELQLRRVVELAGMLDHCDFREQVTLSNPEGRSRPDLVVQLPGGRQVVIDAKAPLQAYLAASEAEDEDTRRRLLGEHARHVRRHLDDLGGRAYWSRLDASAELVILFLPGEPFFAAALAHDPELIERGIDRRVLVAGPTTLIALLRAIAYGWQQERITENAREVATLGRELFERVATLNERFELLGRRLDGAVEAYNSTIGSFESRVQVSARRMAELGVAESPELPELAVLDRRARRPTAPRATPAGAKTGDRSPAPRTAASAPSASPAE